MKRIALLLILSIVYVANISAYDFEVDGIYYNKLKLSVMPQGYEGNLCEVTHGTNKYSGDVVIPTTVKYNDEVYTVIKIGTEAMSGCKELRSVKLADDTRLLTIGGWAFYNCAMLQGFDVPASVTGIDYMAFNGCTSFKTFTVPATVSALGDLAFPALEQLTIEDSDYSLDCVTHYSGNTFRLSLQDIDTLYMGRFFNGLQDDFGTFTNGGMGQGVHTLIVGPMCSWIAPFSFVKANKLKEVIGWENIHTIDRNAFYICQNLESVYLKDVSISTDGLRLERVGDLEVSLDGWYVEFENEPSLKPTALNYLSNAEWFNISHMLDGSKLDSIRISDMSSYINATTLVTYNSERDIIYTINGEEIDTLTVSKSNPRINDGKFANCQSLKTLNLQKGVYEIGDYAFKNCRSLSRINCDNEYPPECNETSFRGVSKDYCIVTVPTGCKEAYESAEGWKEFPYIEEYESTGITDIESENKVDNQTYYDMLGRKINPTTTHKPAITKSNIIIR